jgi:tetratricopeptide (TPR) repeat protein
MTGYGSKQVAEMLGLSVGQVRGYVRAGFLDPARGPRGQLRFSFADIVVLRAARGLLDARIGPRKIRRALARLRSQLPVGRPLAAVRIAAEDGAIVVADGRTRWNPESGQGLLDFDVAELSRKVAPLARRAFREAREGRVSATAEDWYEWGCRHEAESPAEAREAYARAIELEPRHSGALVNLGRLLHEQEDVPGAEALYRRALEADRRDAIAAFNLGVALEDLGRLPEALAAYEQSLEIEPDNPDAHYNAASVCEQIGRPAAALAHLKSYRQLIRPGRP